MPRKLLNSLIASACVLILWGSASSAQAGFIVNPVEPGRGDAVNFRSDAGMQPSSDGERPLPPHVNPHHPQLLAQPASHGSMGAQSLTGSGGSSMPPAIQPTPPVPSAGELTLRLSQQREPYHPRFLKSRLFRPPRD